MTPLDNPPCAPQPSVPTLGEIHLWYAKVPAAQDDVCAARQYALLCDEERQRMARYRTEALQRRYRITRALVRSALAAHAQRPPQTLQFVESTHGRPEIGLPADMADGWRFNVSHTEELVVLAIGLERSFGIDIESPARPVPWRVAQHFFAEPEVRMLDALDPTRRVARFWDLWTLKESYAKALGLGLSLPFDGFWFGFDDHDQPALHTDASPLHPGGLWRFWLADLLGHRLALCAQQDEALPVRLQLWESVPTLHIRARALPPMRNAVSV